MKFYADGARVWVDPEQEMVPARPESMTLEQARGKRLELDRAIQDLELRLGISTTIPKRLTERKSARPKAKKPAKKASTR